MVQIAEQQIAATLGEICKSSNNSLTEIIQGLGILSKLINNIIKNPQEDKFKNFKKTNKAISMKLLSLAPWDSLLFLLEVLGFKENQAEDSYEWKGEIGILNRGAFLIEE